MAYLMLIFSKINELQGYLSQIRAQNKTVGFVPTMGALHEGHISLIRMAKTTCDFTICSIFVNPTQFNDKSDLDRYPRMPEKDVALLQNAHCDALFMPVVKEMYTGKEAKADFNFGYLDKILEGEHRPGHFNGVAQIVKCFFEIIKPNKAFFGSKDYQQVMIVNALVKQINSDIEIVACPILRDPDGLAMSSRNALLSAEERKIAARIPALMLQAKHLAQAETIAAAKAFIKKEIALVPSMKFDYYEVCDATTLQILEDLKSNEKVVALIAVFVGKIRLIDNLAFN